MGTMRFGWLVGLVACSPGVGTLDVAVWGEDAIPQGMTLDDGWEVRFDRWLTTVGNVDLADPKSEESVASAPGLLVVDLVPAVDPEPLAVLEGPAERLRFGFDAPAPTASTAAADGVDAADVATMAANGWVSWIVGEASLDGRVVTFDIGLDLPSQYTGCLSGDDGSDGVVLEADGVTEAVIYMHAEHLFWRSLGTEQSSTGFEVLASLDDGDGALTVDELKAGDAVALGFETAGITDDVYGFLAFSVAQAGHLNGEGLCVVRSL